MKSKMIFLLASGIAITGFSALAFAENGYYSAQVEPGTAGNNGYSSSGSQPNHQTGSNGYSSSGSQPTHHSGTNGYSSSGSRPKFTVGVRLPNFQTSDTYIVFGRGSHRFKGAHWVNMSAGVPIPHRAVVGGGEGGRPLYICRGQWRGGVHPGKIVGQTCHISYAGKEIALPHYQVLVSNIHFGWIAANRGFVPGNAIQGGQERGRKLYICQAAFNGGMHPGKLVGQKCNIAWGGNEVSIPQYNILVG